VHDDVEADARQSGSQADTLHRPAPLQGKCKRHANANANANASESASANANANLASQEGGQQRAAIVSDRTGHRNVRELGGGRRDQAGRDVREPETGDYINHFRITTPSISLNKDS
jgi:hypothetical protein